MTKKVRSAAPKERKGEKEMLKKGNDAYGHFISPTALLVVIFIGVAVFYFCWNSYWNSYYERIIPGIEMADTVADIPLHEESLKWEPDYDFDKILTKGVRCDLKSYYYDELKQKLKEIDLEEFLSLPFVLKGVTENWLAPKNWNKSFFVDRHGDKILQVDAIT